MLDVSIRWSVVLHICCAAYGVIAHHWLTIGGYFPLDGPCWTGGQAVKLTTELALSQVNNRTDILPGYKLRMISNDTKCDPGIGLHILYDHIYNEPNKILLLGPAFSTIAQPIADTAKFWNLLQVSYGATSPALKNRALYPRFFRTISTDLAFNPARVALLIKYGWTRVATLHQNEPSGIFSHDISSVILGCGKRLGKYGLPQLNPSAMKALHKLLHDMDIEVVVGESFTGNPANQLSNIKRRDARIIIGSFYEEAARGVFCEAHKLSMYGQRYVWIIIGWYDDHWWKKNLERDHVTCSERAMSEAVEGYLATDHMKLNEDEVSSGNVTISGLTAQQYAKEFKALTGLDARHESSFAYDAVWAMALALNASIQQLAGQGKYLENFTYVDNEMADIIQAAFYNISFLGVTGRVSFTRNGERLGLIQIEQLQDGESVSVGVFDAITASIMMNKRTPIKWQGRGPPSDRTVRVNELKSVSKDLYTFMAIVAVMGILLGAFFLLINFLYRERRIIKMSSPRLNNLIVVGCIMTYVSVFLFGLDGGLVSSSQYGKVCIARAWIMSLGFTLAFGAMFAKTWRVHAIFKSITPKKKVIRDEHLFIMVSIFMLLDVLLLSLWTGIEPMHTGYEYFDEQMRLEDDKEVIPMLEHCESKNLSYWLGAVYAFKGLLLVFGVFLAWETRAVTIPALNDSRYIGMSVYNVVLLSIMGVAITSVIRSHQNATFAITAVFTIFCTTLTLCFVFLPKVTKLWSPDGGNEASTTRRSTANIPESLSSTDKNAVSMTMENSQLKKMLAEREQQLMELRRLLETIPPGSIISEDASSKEGQRKAKNRRKSLVKFKQCDSTYVNESFVTDEDKSGCRNSDMEMANSSDRGARI